jgi:hypothetical protein
VVGWKIKDMEEESTLHERNIKHPRAFISYSQTWIRIMPLIVIFHSK